jgi:hypothetical protein
MAKNAPTAVTALLTAVIGLGSLFIACGSPGVGSSGVLAQGRLTMAEGDSADLEHGLVGQPQNADVTFYTHDFINDAGMAPAPGQVDKRACVSALSTRHDTVKDVYELTAGSSVCMQTEEGHVAALRIDRLPGVGAPGVAFTYTVWR